MKKNATRYEYRVTERPKFVERNYPEGRSNYNNNNNDEEEKRIIYYIERSSFVVVVVRSLQVSQKTRGPRAVPEVHALLSLSTGSRVISSGFLIRTLNGEYNNPSK